MSNRTIVYDGVGREHVAPLPKLNTALLEECVDWAIRSYKQELKATDPKWYQASWGSKMYSRLRRNARDARGHFSGVYEEVNFCESKYCMAGYALQLTNNLEFEVDEDYVYTNLVPNGDQIGFSALIAEEFTPFSGDVCNGRGLDWMKAGSLALGLTMAEAERLFNGDNDIYTVIDIAKTIAESRNEHIVIRKLRRS